MREEKLALVGESFLSVFLLFAVEINNSSEMLRIASKKSTNYNYDKLLFLPIRLEIFGSYAGGWAALLLNEYFLGNFQVIFNFSWFSEAENIFLIKL